MKNVNKTRKYVKYANFHIASTAKKYTLRVDGFTGNLDDALKEQTSDHSLHLMLIMILILKKCQFLFGTGWWFVNYFCYKNHLSRLYCSGFKMGTEYTTETFLLNIQGFTDYHMSSRTLRILCFLQK